MKGKLILLTAAVALIGLWTIAVDAGDAPKAEKGMIIGEVIDITSYAMKGSLGPDNAEAGLNRASQGFPIGILEQETGKVYVCVYKNPAPASGLETGNELLSKYMGQKVVIQGLIYRAQGVNVVRVAIASEY